MKARDVISHISNDMTCVPGQGWVHDGCGIISGFDDPARLVRFLYRHYYLGISLGENGAGAEQNSPTTIVAREDKDIVARLQAAVPAPFYQSRHWQSVKRHGQTHVVVKKGIHLSVADHELTPEPGKNHKVTLNMPTSRRYASPGFFAAYSACGPADHNLPVDRVYVNVAPTAAPAMLAFILNWAEKLRLPLTVKVANNGAGYDRCDTLVAYFPRAEFRPRHEALFAVMEGIEGGIRPAVPAFAAQVLAGVAWAEDPASDGYGKAGFGMHRCSLIATAFERAGQARKTSPPDLERYVLQVWSEAGLDVNTPHLSPKG